MRSDALKPWQIRAYRIGGVVLVVGLSALCWLAAMLVLYHAMRMVG